MKSRVKTATLPAPEISKPHAMGTQCLSSNNCWVSEHVFLQIFSSWKWVTTLTTHSALFHHIMMWLMCVLAKRGCLVSCCQSFTYKLASFLPLIVYLITWLPCAHFEIPAIAYRLCRLNMELQAQNVGKKKCIDVSVMRTVFYTSAGYVLEEWFEPWAFRLGVSVGLMKAAERERNRYLHNNIKTKNRTP